MLEATNSAVIFLTEDQKRVRFMIEISVRQALQGDCIWIRCISETVTNIVIDAGPSSFAVGFKELIKEIAANDEKIDLLIYSHVDDDHIRGSIPYLRKCEKAIIDKAWINGSGSNVYSSMQEHSARNVSNLLGLLKEKNIIVESPILEGKEYRFHNGLIRVIAPTELEMLKVAEMITSSSKNIKEHGSQKYIGDICNAPDKYNPDSSDTNRASIIIVLEFENKKLLFTGDAPAENIIRAVDRYYPAEKFEILKLPHHGSDRNISRDLLKKVEAKQYIISTKNMVRKTVLKRFIDEKETSEILCNYNWWDNGYCTEQDRTEIIDSGRLILHYIGKEKEVID